AAEKVSFTHHVMREGNMTTAGGSVARRAGAACRSPCGRSCRCLEQATHPHEVVRRRGECEDPFHPGPAAVAQLAEQGNGLEPAEGLLDLLTFPLTDRIAGMTRGATIDRTPAPRAGRVLRDVRGGPELAQGGDMV